MVVLCSVGYVFVANLWRALYRNSMNCGKKGLISISTNEQNNKKKLKFKNIFKTFI